MAEERKFEHYPRHQVGPQPVKPRHFVAENGKRSFSAHGAETYLEFKYWRLIDHLYSVMGKGHVTFDVCVEVAFKSAPKPVDARLWLLSSRFDINEQLAPLKLKLEIFENSGAYLTGPD